MSRRRMVAIGVIATLIPGALFGQDASPPALRVGAAGDTLTIDGLLREPAWATADLIDAFTQTEPSEGAPATFRTTVRVLATEGALVIGVICSDDPGGIVSFSVTRDAGLQAEDHVRIVLGPFGDGRSGYVFAVNPRGARYDSLVTSGGDGESVEWDGIWEAATASTPGGWSVEIRIPVRTLTFKPGVHEWHFNVERRIQRLLETHRWASATRQYRLRQTSRAGLLTELPDFALGRGLDLRPSVTTGGGVPAPSAAAEAKFRPSLDVTQRIGSNVTASLTMNTDFAETEVDTRQTNLTRFPLFFPEKRSFFLEGSDMLQFGPTVNRDVIPFFSRRIGLVRGQRSRSWRAPRSTAGSPTRISPASSSAPTTNRGSSDGAPPWPPHASGRTSGRSRTSGRWSRRAIRWAAPGAGRPASTSRIRRRRCWGTGTSRSVCGGSPPAARICAGIRPRTRSRSTIPTTNGTGGSGTNASDPISTRRSVLSRGARRSPGTRRSCTGRDFPEGPFSR